MVPRKYLILLSFTGLLVALDQLTKNLVVSRLKRPGETLELLSPFLSLTHVHNAGAAFGLLATLPENLREPFFFLVPGLTLAVIFVVFYRLKPEQSLSVFSLSLIVGGALGNLADRVRLGYVVDFLDLHWRNGWHFPAFNVADSGITAGVFLLLLGMLYEREDASSLRAQI